VLGGAGVASGDHARLFGVLGDPVEHSLSPAMHNAAFAAARLPHLYLRYRVPIAALAGALREAKALRMGGVNLTVPLKEAVLPLVDAFTAEAERIGAVNTIVFSPDGRLLGDNTDGAGFLAALRGRIRPRGTRAVIIGAGGSARAVGAALCGAGCAALTIANRTPSHGERLAERLAGLGTGTRVTAVPLAALATGAALADAALVVNATPLGLHGARPPVRYAGSRAGCLFVDLVYGRRPTAFLAAAARAGRPTLDGSLMLLHPGALAFEAWAGRPAPRAAMARALRAAGLALTELSAPASVTSRRPLTR
jgi:shikimate dehydrogenase